MGMGFLDAVKYWIKNGVNVDHWDVFNGHTALHSSSLAGNLDVVKYLVEEAKANVNAVNFEQQKPIYLCVAHIDVVKFLFKKTSLSEKELGMILCESVRKGHLNVVKYFIEECSGDVNAEDLNYCPLLCPNMRGFSPITISTALGQIEIVKYLIKKKAKLLPVLLIRKYEYFSPLGEAERTKKNEVVKFLKKIITESNYLCGVCGYLSENYCCSGCKKVYYCGKKHQEAHWQIHKKECKKE